MANAWKFIEKLDNGIDTFVGQGGGDNKQLL